MITESSEVEFCIYHGSALEPVHRLPCLWLLEVPVSQNR